MRQAESASDVHDTLSRWTSFSAVDRRFCDRDFVKTSGMAGYPDGSENQGVRFVYPTFDQNRRRAFSYGGGSSLVLTQSAADLKHEKEKH